MKFNTSFPSSTYHPFGLKSRCWNHLDFSYWLLGCYAVRFYPWLSDPQFISVRSLHADARRSLLNTLSFFHSIAFVLLSGMSSSIEWLYSWTVCWTTDQSVLSPSTRCHDHLYSKPQSWQCCISGLIVLIHYCINYSGPSAHHRNLRNHLLTTTREPAQISGSFSFK